MKENCDKAAAGERHRHDALWTYGALFAPLGAALYYVCFVVVVVPAMGLYIGWCDARDRMHGAKREGGLAT